MLERVEEVTVSQQFLLCFWLMSSHDIFMTVKKIDLRMRALTVFDNFLSPLFNHKNAAHENDFGVDEAQQIERRGEIWIGQ